MSLLTPTQRYAAGGLFVLALHQAQIHQSRLGSSILPTDEDLSKDNITVGSLKCDSITQDSHLWIHENSCLLRPVLKYLEIDSQAWHGIEETGATSSAKQHIASFLRLLSEGNEENSSEKVDKEIALAKAVDTMAISKEDAPASSESVSEKEQEYEQECREKLPSISKTESMSEMADVAPEPPCGTDYKISSEGELHSVLGRKFVTEMLEERTLLNYQRRIVVLYELLSACLANTEVDTKCAQQRQGYDARHRVALRLLATWLDVRWRKMEAMEVIIASSVMALLKNEKEKDEEFKSPGTSWSSWTRGGIIGAAALTGGTLMAVTGGLAAPAITAGFSTVGLTAAASAAGSVAGSIAVAASFGAAGAGLTGSKMARRIADIEEFEFKAVGENHNQGQLAVGIFISGLVFEEEDFSKPWEGQDYNLERYTLKWESKHLIAVATAIEDWLRSKIATELMKQGAMWTVLSTLLSALSLPVTLLTAMDIIDSKWAIALDRSDKAGKLLAEVLSKGLQGNRPVTLIGFSLGARVIFKCLQTLAETEGNARIVERVVLLGAPVPFMDENWEMARKMVAGRFVNVFSNNDWTLGVAFRASFQDIVVVYFVVGSLLSNGLAGIQPIDVPGVENVDATDIVEGHSSYLCTTHVILERLQLDEFYPSFKPFPPKPMEEKSHQA